MSAERQSVPEEPEVRTNLIEPQIYNSENPLNQKAAEVFSKLREVLETPTGIVEFTLYVNEPPYFQIERDPASTFKAKMSYIDQEGSQVTFHREELELVYWMEQSRQEEFRRAERNNRLKSVSFRLNASHPAMAIWIQAFTGGIYINQVQIIGWEEKETPPDSL